MKTFNIFISLICLLAGFQLSARAEFYWLNSAEIAGMMKSSNPQFKLDKSAVNHTYKYLKYVDKISEQTMLLFFIETRIFAPMSDGCRIIPI